MPTVPGKRSRGHSGSLLRYACRSLAALAGLCALQFVLRLAAPLTEEEVAAGYGSTLGRVWGPPDVDPEDFAAAQRRAEAFLESVTKEHRLVMFGKAEDKQTHKIRQLLLQYIQDEDKIHSVDLDIEPEGRAIHEVLAMYTSGESLPRVYVDGGFVGGPVELVAMDSGGDLEQMLTEKGFVATAAEQQQEAEEGQQEGDGEQEEGDGEQQGGGWM